MATRRRRWRWGESNSAHCVRKRLPTSASTRIFRVFCTDVFVAVRMSSSALGSRLGSDSNTSLRPILERANHERRTRRSSIVINASANDWPASDERPLRMISRRVTMGRLSGRSTRTIPACGGGKSRISPKSLSMVITRLAPGLRVRKEQRIILRRHTHIPHMFSKMPGRTELLDQLFRQVFVDEKSPVGRIWRCSLLGVRDGIHSFRSNKLGCIGERSTYLLVGDPV